MKHILSCSFGKDSIATALLALQHGEPLDELVYCEVMFSEKYPANCPNTADLSTKRQSRILSSVESQRGFYVRKRPIYPAFTMLSRAAE